MTVLHLSPDAPAWMHTAADVILYLHIGGGGLGILSGTVALLTRKGESLHRLAGTVFFVSMAVAYAIGAGVAPFLDDGQRTNTVAGVLALYLLVSSWVTAKRGDSSIGKFEVAGFIIAILAAMAGMLFMYQAARDPTGTIDGSPPQAFVVFASVGTIAAAGDLNAILRHGLSGPARIARHLWRMCVALFIATGSFFLGQQQVFPESLRGSPVLFVPVLLPLLFLIFWLIRVRLTNWFNNH